MRPQSCRSPKLLQFRDSHLDVVPVERRIVYYKGEGGGFPQIWAVVNLVCPGCPWFILTPKVLQLCINHFVLVLCKSVWVSKACNFFLILSRSSSMPLYPCIVLWARVRALTPCSFVVFSLGLTFESLRSWECVKFSNKRIYYYKKISIQVFNTNNLEYNQIFNINSFSNSIILVRQAFWTQTIFQNKQCVCVCVWNWEWIYVKFIIMETFTSNLVHSSFEHLLHWYNI
jgi:hypothetical protein